MCLHVLANTMPKFTLVPKYMSDICSGVSYLFKINVCKLINHIDTTRFQQHLTTPMPHNYQILNIL